jgi:uncharacterized protein (TIGR03437 family)
MKQLVCVVMLLVCLTGFVWAQSIVTTIQSRIVDIDGNPVAGVTIAETNQCFGSNLGPPKTTSYVTDANGRFTWPQLFGGNGTGSTCASTQFYSFVLSKPGLTFTRGEVFYNPSVILGLRTVDERLSLIHCTNAPAWVSVPAASFDGGGILTGSMVTAGFGPNLAETSGGAGEVLPLMLANRQVLVTDSIGVQRPAKLYFVSREQINYVMPEGLSEGSAVVRLVNDAGETLKVGLPVIRKIVPAIFTANANGKGTPAGLLVRVRPGNVQNYEPLSVFKPATNRYDPLPIDLGPPEQFLVLALFGTGWRQTEALSDVFVSIGGVTCSVEYVGKQPTYEGVDQINVRLPRDLIGRGEVQISLRIRGDAAVANTVTLNFK